MPYNSQREMLSIPLPVGANNVERSYVGAEYSLSSAGRFVTLW